MPYRTQSADTDLWAERLLIERWRGMEPWEKMETLDSLEESLREITLASLEERHPHADEEELEFLAACRRFGSDAVERVWNRNPVDVQRTRRSSTSA